MELFGSAAPHNLRHVRNLDYSREYKAISFHEDTHCKWSSSDTAKVNLFLCLFHLKLNTSECIEV